MKKTHKKAFGLLGLALVVVMTAVAALIPGPETSAATSTSFSDNISVTVIDEVPSAKIISPTSGEEVVSRDNPIQVNYTNLNRFTVTITYTDEDGTEHTEVIADETPTEGSGTASVDYSTVAQQYGYGSYRVTLAGEGMDGSVVEDSVEFTYEAAEVDIQADGESGEISIDLNYDNDDPTLTDEEKVDKIEVEILDKDGNPIPGVDPIVVMPPADHVDIDFNEYGLPEGDYIIAVNVYNKNGELLPGSKRMTVHYNGSIVVPSTADTGGLFKGLNISSTDYLITGIGVFLVVGIGGLILINKRSKKTSFKRR